MGRDFVQHEPVTVGRQRDDDRICTADQICCALSDRRIEHAFDGTLGRQAFSLGQRQGPCAGWRPERCLVSQFFKKCGGAKGNRARTRDTYSHVVFHFN
ncbi:hypothetical protein D9M68_449930 [compost metagenome]